MAEIQLSRGYVARVDDGDLVRLAEHKWSTSVHGGLPYASAWIGGRNVYMHRYLMAAEESDRFVDHRDGDTLNNTRANLRFCTHAQNQVNRRLQSNNQCGAKNVRPYFTEGGALRFQVEVKFGGVRVRHRFKTLEEAVVAAHELRQRVQGEFAPALERAVAPEVLELVREQVARHAPQSHRMSQLHQ